MALQDPNILAMVGLGTLHDAPANTLQPKLVDAVHLRWAFRPDLGFPWHGFYLYRRDARKGRALCLGSPLTEAHSGSLNTSAWASGIGTVLSDQVLILKDEFPPANTQEIDLEGRSYVEFLPLQVAHSVDIKIGFKKSGTAKPICLDFVKLRPQVLSNPYQRLNISLQSIGADRKPVAHNEIVSIKIAGHATSAFVLAPVTKISTAEKVDEIDIRLFGPKKITVAAIDAAGKKVAGKVTTDPLTGIQTWKIAGTGLHDATIATPGVGYLLTICVAGADLKEVVEIPINASAGGIQVAETVASGVPGDVVSVTLEADVIDRIHIDGGSASLIDLCWTSAIQFATAGWEPLGELEQPIALPVRHPDYPASGSLPTNIAASRAEALSRIRYGDPNIWKTPFDDIHEQCLNGVKGGPAIPMNSLARSVSFPVEVEPGDTSQPPANPQQQPLQLLLLGAMHAPIAEMLGLYWSDKTAVPGHPYDYLVVSDSLGKVGQDASKVLSLIQSEGFVNVDGYIVFDKQVEAANPLDPPTDARAFALPGTTRPNLDGTVTDATCNAGLTWDLPMVNNVLIPDGPVLYHMWRVDYGENEPAAEEPVTKFKALNPQEPVMIVESLISITGVQRPQDWPPFPLYGFDNAVDEGWYGYRVSNVDIFGRHSALGPSARWFEWAPVPEPKPWYYVDPPGDTAVHPFAVGLLDKMPPPPPTGVEAYALDPADPFVQRDAPFTNWFDTLSASEKETVVGLRVRWNWTLAHMRQAPDTKEFRIYYQPGRLNCLLGAISAVSAASPTESFVQTDIANTQPVDAFVGCSLKIGPNMFTIVGSEAGAHLRIRVKNIGPLKDVVPSNLSNCEVNIPNNHALFTDFGVAHNWSERTYVVGFNEHVSVGVDGDGNPLRQYEVFLPDAGDSFRGGLDLIPTVAEPIAFAAVGVTASDDRPHTADDPKWSTGRFGDRPGNEGTMSPAALVFRVLRDKPAPPVPPPDSDRVFATPADYHAISYYTFRWVPQAHLKAHVYRAMDDTIFTVDWSFQPRAPIDPNNLSLFPDEGADPRWNDAKRQEVATELDTLHTFAHTDSGKEQAKKFYRNLSNDGLRVLANLPGNESAFAQLTITALDPNDPALSNRVGPDNPPAFPIDPGLRIFIDALDGRSTNRFLYKACYVDGAQNRSRLSSSGPPIWLPNVVPPKSPTFTKVLAGAAAPNQPGDNKITLRWASNREEDLAEYRVYRAMTEADSRSIRTMELVHSLAVAPGDPALRPAENVWTDVDLTALQWIYYRMTAVDVAGNESTPNATVTARAFDQSLPVVPALAVAWVAHPDNDARAHWTANIETRLERRAATELIWENVSDWLPPGTHTIDDSINQNFPWKFRLRARKPTGAMKVGPEVNLLRK